MSPGLTVFREIPYLQTCISPPSESDAATGASDNKDKALSRAGVRSRKDNALLLPGLKESNIIHLLWEVDLSSQRVVSHRPQRWALPLTFVVQQLIQPW